MHRILFATTISRTLGTHLYPLVKHFSSLEWQVDGVARDALQNREDLVEYDQLFDVAWSRNPLDLRNFLLAIPQFQKLILSGNYDLVHVHTPIAAFITRLALRILPMSRKPKVIYTAHGFHFYRGGPMLKNFIFLLLEKIAGWWTDYLVVINEEDFSAAMRFRFVPEKLLQYMPGIGVDLEYYTRDRISHESVKKIRQELGLVNSDKLFLMVAEFIPRKCHADALKAIAKLNNPDVHLAFAGSGLLFERMKQLALNLRIEENVHFLGRRSDVPELMCASDALVLPSRQEGLPRCVLEAMSLEVPVIGTDIRGTGELLTNGAGLVVRVGDVNTLADAMDWISTNPFVALKMGQKGRVQSEQFSLRRILHLHDDLYARLLA